jgi:hypothetical protein
LTSSDYHPVRSDELADEGVAVSRKIVDRPSAVFIASLVVRVTLAAVFLGSSDTINALTAIPLAATRKFFFLPYFPIVQNILGATTPLVNHAHFVPIGLTVKLVPCVVDSLLSVWLLQNNRFDRRFRRNSAWLYAFCPLPLILICLQGQWDSLWVLPAVTALALSDLLPNTTRARQWTLLLIGALLGLAVLSKPAALIVVGLLFPSFHYRASILGWLRDVSLILTGAAATVVLFFLKFAANGDHVEANIRQVFNYGGHPGSTLFGPANLSFFNFLNNGQTSAAQEFRELAIVYVVGIALYQLLARQPIDRMSAAAAALLISPAIGGLDPQYMFWPFVFILASGRLRMASVYAGLSSCVYFLFFLLPGASYNTGENLGALVPLRSLRFLGLPDATIRWFSSPSAMELWHPLANLLVPLAMCALGVYLLGSRWPARSASEVGSVEPLALRSLRTLIPYTALMVLVVLAYGVVSRHDAVAAISSINHGVNRYAFVTPMYSWSRWAIVPYWTVKHPYRNLLSGSWWGTVLIYVPIGIAAWGAFALRFSRRNAPMSRDAIAAPTPSAGPRSPT